LISDLGARGGEAGVADFLESLRKSYPYSGAATASSRRPAAASSSTGAAISNGHSPERAWHSSRLRAAASRHRTPSIPCRSRQAPDHGRPDDPFAIPTLWIIASESFYVDAIGIFRGAGGVLF
jgi:hypothetical protein